jgi:hypothetical protein
VKIWNLTTTVLTLQLLEADNAGTHYLTSLLNHFFHILFENISGGVELWGGRQDECKHYNY